MSIEEFAAVNDLVMDVHERSVYGGRTPRYWATFNRTECKDKGLLVSAFGNGDTEELAIQAYAKRISEETLVLNAFAPTRTEIHVPTLTEAI